MTILLPPFQFGCRLFLLLVWSLWLGLPELCWIRVVKANIPVLFLILGGMLLVFAHWEWCCWRFFIYGLNYIEVCSSIPTLLRVFIVNGCSTLWNVFFCIYWYDHVVFILHFVYVVNHIYRLVNIVPTLHPRKNPTWSWCVIFWIYFWILFANIL